MNVAIAGYGNLGRGVEAAVTNASDMELVGIFTRRDPATVKVATDTPVYAWDELVDRAKDGYRLVAQVHRFQNAVENLAVVDVNDELIFKSEPAKERVDYQNRLDIRLDARRSNRIEVALNELAITPVLRVLSTPNRGDVVSLKRRAEFVNMLSRKSGKRHCQVEPHADVAPAGVLELVHLLVRFVRAFALKNLQIFQSWRIDRSKTKRFVHLRRGVDNLTAGNHRFRKVIPETLKSLRGNHI